MVIRKLHPSVIGKFFEEKITLPVLTTNFNTYRKMFGLSPVKEETVHRYNGGKSGYEASVPSVYRSFLLSLIA